MTRCRSAACGLLLASSTCLAAAPRTTPVILISVDTLRADRLSCYGYRGRPTPNIDSLARGGTLFSAVSAPVPLTLPSHISLLTSSHPFWHGVEDNGGQLRQGALTLAGVLRSQGYSTAAFIGGFVLDRRFGLDQGFDHYDSKFQLHRQSGRDPGDIKRLGEEVAAEAIRWIEGHAGTPFFLFLHLYDLHTPYNLPRAHRVRFKGAGYLAELGYVDHVLGQFCKSLAQRGLMDKTLIVFTSDHGEGLGDHGEDTHGYFIYQSTVWVPLIIHWPGPARPLPARVEEPASSLDVAPTILHALGISSPQPFQGRSLLSRPDGRLRDLQEVYSESLYGRNHFGVGALLSLRVGRHKYIEAPRPELYDLAADPGEVHNLYEKQRFIAMGLRSRLLALRSRFARERAPGPTQPSPEVVAQLRSLGYLAGGRAAMTSSGVNPADRIVEFRQFGRAITLASSGRLSEANVLLEELLRKDGRLVDVRMALGLNKQKLGRHAEAVEQFRDVLQKDGLNVLAHFNLAVSYFALGQFDGAIKELRATLELAPYYTRAEELLGNIRLQQNDYAQARFHFMRILTVAPADYAANYNLGILEMREGRLQDAEHHLRLAADADPLSAEARNALGSFYLQQGDLNRARDELVKGVRLDPKSPVPHYNLGLALRRLGLPNEAIREFELALAADPQFQPARAALDQLRRR